MMPADAEKERRLVYALRVLAEETSAARPSPELEQKLLAALREPRRMRPVRWGWVAALAAAMALLVIVPGFVSRPALQPAGDTTIGPIAPLSDNDADALTPWYVDEALPVAESGSVVRLEVSRATALEYGAVLPATQSGVVQAEFFVGDDGLARAIRFVR